MCRDSTPEEARIAACQKEGRMSDLGIEPASPQGRVGRVDRTDRQVVGKCGNAIVAAGKSQGLAKPARPVRREGDMENRCRYH
jgi:hypothetical protein